MKSALPVFLCGFAFALGLGLSGMTLPSKIIGFLDFTGAWDPTLLVVMVGALIPTSLLYRVVLRRKRPLFGQGFSLPGTTQITARLVAGSAIFGIGWGLGGYCPGPGVVALMSFKAQPLLLVLGVVAGMLLYDRAWPRLARKVNGAVVRPATPEISGKTDG